MIIPIILSKSYLMHSYSIRFLNSHNYYLTKIIATSWSTFDYLLLRSWDESPDSIQHGFSTSYFYYDDNIIILAGNKISSKYVSIIVISEKNEIKLIDLRITITLNWAYSNKLICNYVILIDPFFFINNYY